jgi:glycosyltransferase involved in cell wall biosynthesis
MEECGVNTEWLKDLAIEKSGEHFSDEVVQQLEKIIQPHYLGVDDISTGHDYKPKTILFNHRDNEYTGWVSFVKSMDKLWEKRQDFKVYTTLTNLDRPYAERVKLHSRTDYLNFVRSMHMGVGCFKKYSAWSISTTDGLSQGVPYILPDGMCYPEMVGGEYPLLYNGDKDFIKVIESMLDNPNLREEANKYLEPKLEGFKWSNRISKWFDGWKYFDELKPMSDTDSYKKIVNYIHSRKSVSKKDILEHLGWGVRISFSEYRNRLRLEDTIKFTKNRYEVI